MEKILKVRIGMVNESNWTHDLGICFTKFKHKDTIATSY